MKRALRIAAGLVLGVLLLIGGAMVALEVAIARGELNTQIDAALERAIGREVNQGAFSLRLGLRPRIAMADATIANIPGGSRPDFARIGRLDVTLALLPLLSGRVEIDSVRLADADIILERDAEGRANWIFGPGGSTGSAGGLTIAAVDIETSRILLPGGPVTTVEIPALHLARDEPGDPLELDGRIRLDDEALSVSARLGPEVDGVLAMDASIEGQGLRLRLHGAWPRGTDAPGWSLAVQAEADRAAAQRLGRRFGRLIPATGPISLAARLGPGMPVPAVSDLVLRVGETDLGTVLTGLRLSRAELRAASFDGPATIAAQGRRGAADLGLTATLPSLRRLATWPEGQTQPIEAVLTSGRARLALSGPIRRDLDLGAAVFDARLTTPDFALVGPVLGVALPRVTGVTTNARLGGLTTRELRLDALSVSADALALQGNLAITLAERTAFRGQLVAQRVDLDALGGGPAARPAHRGEAGRQIPDIALPIDTLRGADVALRLSAAQLIVGGVTWRDASGTVALTNGRLAIDPLAVTTPGGPVAGQALLDAAAQPARLELRIDSRGRGLDLAALRRAFGVPAGFEGSAELALDLRGQGSTTRAVAASLTGELGIAMVGGRFTGATALRIGPDLSRALLPRGTPAEGVTLRCLALRLSAEAGVARSETLLMVGDFGRIDGTLAFNLRDETIAARLLPDIRLMGVTVRAPVTIGGTLAEPRIGVDPGAAMARVIGDTVANRLWRSSTIEFLRDATGSAPPGGDCGPALTLARLGRAGPMPDAAAAPIPLVPREIQGAAQDVLRGIGGLLGGRRR
ncbi:AsmA family protein [Roseomonas sp. CAU 1739]|uniref:AsmA family protein n=1 Tax=Roseomonas sp. CAU 1739 TaxID=3140364 RepID=UPI00325AB036